jgi:(S)-ureidoglycine aminohydrolase
MKIASPAPSAINRVSRFSLAVLFGLSLLSVVAGRTDAQDAKAAAASPAPDTLTAQVSEWSTLKVTYGHGGISRRVLKGSTHDLSMLDISAFTLGAGHLSHATPQQADADALVIVKEGSLTVMIEPISKVLGPGGVALFAAGELPDFRNAGVAPATYYIFRFRSRSAENRNRARQAGTPFLIDWKEMMMKTTNKGESRPIFDRAVAWLGKIDMHATTLNAGEVSHPPHIHRAEEIILMRSGNVEEYIDGKYYKASAGDLIFLPSGIPHALENKSKERCEYFALQWMQ